MNRVITISREFGSGGRTIGRKVAEKLGIPCYDAEIIEKIAEESGYSGDYIRSEGEGASDRWLSNLFSNRAMGPTNQDTIWVIQSRIIRELAEKGPCVIVGRCADYVLRARLTYSMYSSMQIPKSVPNASSVNTGNAMHPRLNASGKRTDAELPITGSTPT